MLTRAMGIEEEVEPSISEIQCFKGDTLVISSDGLTDLVRPEEILAAAAGVKPEKACRVLVDMANSRGGGDNISVVVLTVKGIQRNDSAIAGFLSRIKKFFIK
jgi:protein phosphatase